MIKNQDIVKQFLKNEEFGDNLLYCIGWDTMYIYKDGWYHGMTSDEFRKIVWGFIIRQYPELNMRATLVYDIIQQIKWATKRQVKEIDTPYIAFKNKLFNIEFFQWEEFDINKIAIHKLEFSSEELESDCPKFNNFLLTTLVTTQGKTDRDLVELMQQMFGFYLLNDMKAQIVFFLVGQGANGKSVMTSIIEEMIGTKFCSAMSIQNLTMNQFATANLIGKKINICNEEESKFMRSDKFKALVSGDLVQAERKHETQFAFRPKTKYLFASNRMPSFEGINYGLRRRIIIVPFNKIFTGQEQNKNLSKELISEMPGIIKWAIKGAKILIENNYQFTSSRAIDKSKEDFENTLSSALMFVRETYKIDDYGFVENMMLYKEYTIWCTNNGKKAMSSISFNRDITENTNIKTTIKWNGYKTARGKNISPREYGDDEEEAKELSDTAKVNQLLGLDKYGNQLPESTEGEPTKDKSV